MDQESDELFPQEEDEKPSLSKCQIFIFFSGLLMLLFSIAMLAGGYGAMFDAIFKMEMEVKEGTVSYEIWKTTPFPLILNLYIWNITNHEAFIKGEKPDLQQCGPYVWKEYHEKQNLTFHDNHTVTFYQQRWWIWDEELSGNNSKDDVIYSINPIPLSAAWAVRNNPIYIAFMNEVFNAENEQVVVKTTANEIIFTGFQDPVLDWVQKNLIAENGTYHPLLPLLNLPPGIANYDKFGWFYGRNLSLYYDGVFNMFTGTDDVDKVGEIDLWNYTRATDFFEAPCNNVEGSAGEFFDAGLQREKLVFYSSDLCMSMTLFYKEDVSHDGIKAYRFWGSNHTFANGSMVAGNECYCVQGTCAPMGLLNAESCRMGSPAFISFPHYLNADPFLLEQVNGLSPSEDEHSFLMDIMPEAGIPVNVNARMQINMRVKPYPGEGILHAGRIDILKEVPDIYLPMIWFEELAGVPQDMVKQLRGLQFIMSTPTITICFAITLLAGLAMMVAIAYIGYRLKNLPPVVYDDRFPNSI